MLALYFFKRIMFLVITFFVAEGSIQCLSFNLVYMASVILFGIFRPLRSRRANCLGLLNDFLLLFIVSHTFYFSGLQSEENKYDLGKSMLICIAVFVILNVGYFFSKGMMSARIWLLRMLTPEQRQDLAVCLSYMHMRWMLFNDFKEKPLKTPEQPISLND